MAPSVAPPTPQEIQRKLSVHSASRIKPSTTSTFGGPSPSNISNTLIPGTSGISSSWGTAGIISGTESDSDSVLTPDIASSHAGFSLPSTSLMQPPLSSIAEQSPGSGGEDSDEEDDDGAGWRVVTEGAKVGGATSGVGGQTRAADVVLKSGYLSKKGERRKTWKKRWFVLRPTHLAFYKTDAEYKLLRLLDLNDVHSCVPVSLKRHSNVFGLILPKRTYYLQAASAQNAQDWVEAIEEARQTLMATSTQNSGNNGSVSTPIPIPKTSTTDANLAPHPLSISISPHQQNTNTAQLISSSDSEDAISQLAAPPIGGPPPLSGGGGGGGGTERGGGGLVAPSPTNVTFAPMANKPLLPGSPPPKDASTSASKIILSGYLMKCGSKRRNWRKRWFVLTAEKLVYSRSHMDTKPHRIFVFTDILDAMDYDLPKHRSHHYHHHPHTTAGLTPSLSASSPPSTGEGALGTGVGTASSLTASQTSTLVTGGANLHAGLGTETQQGGRNFTFKIVTTKRSLLLCAPSEEDEIKWLGAVRALIARRTASGPAGALQQQQQQQQGPSSSTPAGEGAGGSGVAGIGGSSGGGGGGGIKSKVRRLSASAGVLGVGGGKSSTTTTATIAVVGGAPTTTTMSTAIGAAGAAGDETRDTH